MTSAVLHIPIIGDKESAAGSGSLRRRDGTDLGVQSLIVLLARLANTIARRAMTPASAERGGRPV
jgi:hypothetical protein